MTKTLQRQRQRPQDQETTQNRPASLSRPANYCIKGYEKPTIAIFWQSEDYCVKYIKSNAKNTIAKPLQSEDYCRLNARNSEPVRPANYCRKAIRHTIENFCKVKTRRLLQNFCKMKTRRLLQTQRQEQRARERAIAKPLQSQDQTNIVLKTENQTTVAH